MESKRQYFNSLDGLRAICIIFTIAAHTPGNYYVNGSVGVDVFFALSGYLITTLLLRERNADGNVCITCFYIRRAFRIVPLYLLTIALYIPGALLAYHTSGSTERVDELTAALPWLLSFNSEFRSADAGNLFGHAWTLGIEEKFYILWPFCFAFIAVGKRRFGLLAIIPFLLLAGSDMARGYIGILFGVIAALTIEDGDRGKVFIRAVPTGLWLGLMVCGYVIATEYDNFYLNLLISLPASLFIAALINKENDFFQKVLSWPALVKVGRLTYAIYLIHRLVINVFDQLFAKLGLHPGFVIYFCLAYGASIVIAWVLHLAIERPLIDIGKRLARRSGTKTIPVAT